EFRLYYSMSSPSKYSYFGQESDTFVRKQRNTLSRALRFYCGCGGRAGGTFDNIKKRLLVALKPDEQGRTYCTNS
ncbi:MAG: hypothetical protein AAGG68_28850, partial [Bacteroidota bacterium]